MTKTLKSFKLPLAIAAAGILTFNSHAQPVAIGAIGNIIFTGGGGNVAVDSFNSHDTNYSLNGQYSPSMAKSNGNVASEYGFVNFATKQIDGNLYLGPNAAYSGSGFVTGTIYNNYNVQFPDIALPPGANSWAVAVPAIVQVAALKNNGAIVSNTITAYHFTTSGNYIVNQDLPIVVEAGVTVNLNVTSSAYTAQGMYISGGMTNSGTAALYFNGPTSITISGNTAVNANTRPENLLFFGLPSLTSITIATTVTTFNGVIYAPAANLILNGGGNSYDISGTVIVNSISDKGHYNFHFDESLASGQVWINSQPSSQAVPPGSNATFTVSVLGTAPFWYDWYQRSLDPSNLLVRASGTNYSPLTLTNIQASDAGFYFVVVSNAFGSMTSSNALLTVLPASPTITAQATDLR